MHGTRLASESFRINGESCQTLHRGATRMTRHMRLLGSAVILIVMAAGGAGSTSAGSANVVLDPANFVAVVNNPYFPLPVGRTLVYAGTKEGQTLIDTVTVTADTKTILGITATAVSDVSTHDGPVLEKTFDWYAQDQQGNVWYLGEDTTAFLPNGKADTSGSWEAGVHGAQPGIIMEANPQIPDAYRQEFLAGQAEDTAWVVELGGTVTVPYGKLRNALTTLEATRIEPGLYDQKIYAPGVGIVLEQSLTGPTEIAKLVSVSGP